MSAYFVKCSASGSRSNIEQHNIHIFTILIWKYCVAECDEIQTKTYLSKMAWPFRDTEQKMQSWQIVQRQMSGRVLTPGPPTLSMEDHNIVLCYIHIHIALKLISLLMLLLNNSLYLIPLRGETKYQLLLLIALGSYINLSCFRKIILFHFKSYHYIILELITCLWWTIHIISNRMVRNNIYHKK